MFSSISDTGILDCKEQLFELPAELVTDPAFVSCYFNFSNSFLDLKELQQVFNDFITNNKLDLSIFLRPKKLIDSNRIMARFSDKCI